MRKKISFILILLVALFVLTACMQIESSYRVTFNTEGGSLIPTQIIKSGFNAEKPEDPLKEEHHFIEWQLNGEKFDFSTPITGRTNLVAKWQVNQYKATFLDYNDLILEEFMVDWGSEAEISVIPNNKEGYHFVSWDKDTLMLEDTTFKAIYEINVYEVYFNNLNERYKKEVNHGDKVTAFEIPDYEGHTFKGWFLDEEFSELYDFDQEIEADLTLYANWEINTYKVIFETNNYLPNFEVIYEFNEEVGLLNDLDEVGYLFGGWYYDDETFLNKVKPADKNLVLEGEITLYAKWDIKVYEVKFFDIDGFQIGVTQYINHGDNAVPPTPPVVEGQDFSTWSVGFNNVTKDLEVHAMYGISTYTVIFLDYKDDQIGEPQVVAHGFDAEAPLISQIPTEVGYSFDSWNKSFENITEDTTIKALYKVNQYTITFNSNGGSAVEPITQNYGTEVTAPTNPTKEGYTFTGWSPALPTSMPAENLTVTAQYTIDKYLITFVDEDGTTVLDSAEFNYGTMPTTSVVPTKDATAQFTYTFADWTPAIVSVTGVASYKATYTATANTYKLTFMNEDEVHEEYNVAFGTNIENMLKNEPTREGYTFDGWDKTIPEAMPAENLIITAKWEKDVEFIKDFDEKYTFGVLDKTGTITNSEELKPIFEHEYLVEVIVDGNVYNGNGTGGSNVYNNQKGIIKYGTGSAVGSITLKYQENVLISTVVIYAAGFSTTENQIIVNGQTITLDIYVERHEIELTEPSSEIVIQTIGTKRRVILFGIELYGEEATIVLPKYSVDFDTDGGTPAPATQQIEDGSKATQPTNPTKDGYDFVEWQLNGKEFKFDDEVITRDITLVAKWEMIVTDYIEDAEIEFDFSGFIGSGIVMTQGALETVFNHEYLSSVEMRGSVYNGNGTSSNPYSSQSKLIKFGTTSANGELIFKFNGDILIKNIVIYAARWSSSEGSIIVNDFNPAGGSNILDEYMTRYVVELDEATNEVIIKTTEKRAFLFNVAFYGPEAEVPELIEYEVSFETNGGNNIDSIMVEKGQLLILPTDPTKDGFTFDGWYTDTGLNTPFNDKEAIEEDMALYAKWEEIIEVDEENLIYFLDFTKNPDTTGGNNSYLNRFGINVYDEVSGNNVLVDFANGSKQSLGGNDANRYFFAGQTKSNYYFDDSKDGQMQSTTIRGGGIRFNVNEGEYSSMEFSFYYDNRTTNQNKPSSIEFMVVQYWDIATSTWKDAIDFTGKKNDIVGGTNNVFLLEFDSIVSTNAFRIRMGTTSISNNGQVIQPNYLKLFGESGEPLPPKEKYAVKYKEADGTYIDEDLVDEGSLITKPSDPIKEGYELEGWYKEEELINKWDFDNDVMPNSDLTLYAKWGLAPIIEYKTITLDTDATGYPTSYADYNFLIDGHTFTGIKLTKNGAEARGFSIQGNSSNKSVITSDDLGNINSILLWSPVTGNSVAAASAKFYVEVSDNADFTNSTKFGFGSGYTNSNNIDLSGHSDSTVTVATVLTKIDTNRNDASIIIDVSGLNVKYVRFVWENGATYIAKVDIQYVD